MKFSAKFLFNSVVLFNATTLFAQNNQVTVYKIEGIDNRKIISPLGAIGQRAKTTANYELPTTNCDNSAGSLNDHLMMDPSTLEEGAKEIGGTLGIFGRRAVAAGRTVTEEEVVGGSSVRAGSVKEESAVSSNSGSSFYLKSSHG